MTSLVCLYKGQGNTYLGAYACLAGFPRSELKRAEFGLSGRTISNLAYKQSLSFDKETKEKIEKLLNKVQKQMEFEWDYRKVDVLGYNEGECFWIKMKAETYNQLVLKSKFIRFPIEYCKLDLFLKKENYTEAVNECLTKESLGEAHHWSYGLIPYLGIEFDNKKRTPFMFDPKLNLFDALKENPKNESYNQILDAASKVEGSRGFVLRKDV